MRKLGFVVVPMAALILFVLSCNTLRDKIIHTHVNESIRIYPLDNTTLTYYYNVEDTAYVRFHVNGGLVVDFVAQDTNQYRTAPHDPAQSLAHAIRMNTDTLEFRVTERDSILFWFSNPDSARPCTLNLYIAQIYYQEAVGP